MGSDENLTNVLGRALKYSLGEMHVAMPGRIVSYDYKTQKASVQPTISRKYKDGRIEAYGSIDNVPVVFTRSGGASLTMPVKENDPVLLIFADRSIDSYMASGGVQTQDDVRQHSLTDAIALVGLYPFATDSQAENNEDVLLDFDGNKMRMKPNGNTEIVCEKSITLKCGSSSITMTPNHIVIKADRIDENP